MYKYRYIHYTCILTCTPHQTRQRWWDGGRCYHRTEKSKERIKALWLRENNKNSDSWNDALKECERKTRENISAWSGKRWRWREKGSPPTFLSPVPSRFTFVFAHPKFHVPDAWNRLQEEKNIFFIKCQIPMPSSLLRVQISIYFVI